MEAIVYLFFIGIGIIITILAVRTAIDYSRTSGDIAEIRRLLQTIVENGAVTKTGAGIETQREDKIEDKRED
jgi:cytochrome c-type biogenesis protein CcmE